VLDGYAVLEGFVGADELPTLRAAVEEHLARPLPPGCERPSNTLAPLACGDPLLDLVLGDDRRVERLRRTLGATDLRWISGYVSTKPARSGPLWWHQDWWCWDHPVSYRPGAPQVAVLVYLTPTTERSGALRVLPGSHRRSLPLHALLPEAHTKAADDVDRHHPALADQPGQITVAAAAGDAVAMDYRLLHGTHPHEGADRRDALLVNFAPDWAGLPADVRAHLVRHPAQNGELPSWRALLPHYEGTPADLPLRRDAPAEFAVA
jgi:ectoine hydroxylase-related dioxygenase (phytanoyl-CoA dioxygenase family)